MLACLTTRERLLLGIVGTDVNSGVVRFDFGIPELSDGIGVVVVAMGLFPPWLAFSTSASRGVDITGYPAVYAKGYSPLFLPPEGPGVFVDLSRLLVQWVIVAAVTLGLVVTYNTRPTADRP